MVVLLTILIVSIITIIILNLIKDLDDSRSLRVASIVGCSIMAFLLGIIVTYITTPTASDYVKGKVGIEIKQIYREGKIISCDTIYYFK